MGERVPLVVYKKGVRVVIGEAEVEEDGSIRAYTNDPEIKEALTGDSFSHLSIWPKNPQKNILEESLRPPFIENNFRRYTAGLVSEPEKPSTIEFSQEVLEEIRSKYSIGFRWWDPQLSLFGDSKEVYIDMNGPDQDVL